MSVKTTYEGEVMLAGWTDSHTGGAKIVLWLPDAESLAAFRHLTVKKGNTAGQRFMAVLVEIGDDDQPIQKHDSATVAPAPAKGGNLAKDAAIICGTPDFQRFTAAHGNPFEANPESAAALVRRFCEVGSRRELDHRPVAAALFSKLMTNFRKWRDEAPT